MKSTHSAAIAAALLGAAVLQATPALAQRVFVAAQGADANPCTFALPCRTFQHAHDVVAAGGEIDVLDPAGYGAVTISKAVSIQGHGFSGVSVTGGGTAITIAAGPTDAINLNGLLIEGGGTGDTGIIFNGGKSLAVENSVIRNMVSFGLRFASSTTTLRTLSVSNSSIANIGTVGILVQALSPGAVTAAIDRVGFFNNGAAALEMDGTGGTGALNVAVKDSVAAHDSGLGDVGFLVQSSGGHSVASLVLTRAKAVGSDVGVQSIGANATLRLAQSTITGNTTGYAATSGGTILSYGDNYIDGNGTNLGALGPATKQ